MLKMDMDKTIVTEGRGTVQIKSYMLEHVEHMYVQTAGGGTSCSELEILTLR